MLLLLSFSSRFCAQVAPPVILLCEGKITHCLTTEVEGSVPRPVGDTDGGEGRGPSRVGPRDAMPTSSGRPRGAWSGVIWMLILLLMADSYFLNDGETRDAPGASPARTDLSSPGFATLLSPDPPKPNALTGAAPAPYTYTDTRSLEQNKERKDCSDCSSNTNTDNLQRGETGGTDSVNSDSDFDPTKNGSMKISFYCSRTRCKRNDCYVVYPDYDSEGEWAWKTIDPNLVTVSRVSSLLPHKVSMWKVEVIHHNPLSEMPDLWCFTAKQLNNNPVCDEFVPNFKLFPFRNPRCLPAEKVKPPTPVHLNKVMRSVAQPEQPPSRGKENSAMRLMLAYVHERNISKCWVCQHMPSSLHSPMFSPVPFSLADYKSINWNDLGSRMEKGSEDCYTKVFPVNASEFYGYQAMGERVVEEVNKHHLPVKSNLCKLLTIHSVKLYTDLGMKYRMSVALVQTNCSSSDTGNSLNAPCVPQLHTPSLLVDALIEAIPWIGSQTTQIINVKIHNCSAAILHKKPPLRNCSQYLPPIQIQELQNVSLCFKGVGPHTNEQLGTSKCSSEVPVTLQQSPLPERVYLVCGDKAYSCMPYSVLSGVCYLAYLVPFIREVQTSELALLHNPVGKSKREISKSEQVWGVIIPSYGVFLSHREIATLSKVLESHLNASSHAMLAEHKELQEVKTVALQNRMALDLLLAAQGGTCKVIGSECCSYISDATSDVKDMLHDTAKGLKELQDIHTFDFGNISSIFGSWGAGLIRFLTLIAVLLISLVLIISYFVTLVKCVLKRATTTTVTQAPQIVVNNIIESVIELDQWVPPFNADSDNGVEDAYSWEHDFDY